MPREYSRVPLPRRGPGTVGRNADGVFWEQHYVPGEGPVPARVMLVGEGPGEEEDRQSRPFVGKTGGLLNRMLRQGGLNRDEMFVTNLVRYRVPRNGDPTARDIRRDEADLKKEIREVRPEIVATLGRHSTRYFLDDVDMEWCHGLPFDYRRRSKIIQTVLPVFHPAFGLHSPEMLPLIQDDIRQLALLIRGKLDVTPRVDAHPNPVYRLVKSSYVGRFDNGPIYVDTEGSIEHPWGLSWTQTSGEAKVLLASNAEGLKNFAEAIHLHSSPVVLHNALFDVGVLRAMGIELPSYRDTMVVAYHLCLEPQGLKPLARRLAGMSMQSYDDVIGAARRTKALEYLKKVGVWADKHYPRESRTPSRRARPKAQTPSRDGMLFETASPVQ